MVLPGKKPALNSSAEPHLQTLKTIIMNRFSLFLKSFLFLYFPLAAAIIFAQQKKPAGATAKTAGYTYKIIESNNQTFGYDIYAGKKLQIHQPSIPAMPGNEGFKSKAGAEKIARLIIKKIHRGEMPPTISIQEMKAVKAI